MCKISQREKKHFSLKVVLLGSVFSTLCSISPAKAQLSIMGALDSRTNAPQQQSVVQPKIPAAQPLTARPAIPLSTGPKLQSLPRPQPQINPAQQQNLPFLNQPMTARPTVPLNTGPSFYSQPRPQPRFEPNQPVIQPTFSQSPVPQTQTQSRNELLTTPSGDKALFSANEVGFERELGIITARGNVEITYGGRVLVADTVSYNQNEDMVTASGNVQILEPNGNVTLSDYVEITSDLRNGAIRGIVLALSDQSLIQAEKGKRRDGRYTTVENAEYSPCLKCEDNPDRPLKWKLSANEIEHDNDDGYVEYYNAFLEVYDIPVLYTPYFSHPDPTKKRESGLLTPSYGSISNIGNFVSVPYYHVFDDSTDFTIEPKLFFDKGQLFSKAEYRQKTRKGEYKLAGSGTYVDGGDGATEPDKSEFRGHIDSFGLFDINNTWRWGFDVNASSDETYIRKYNIDDPSQNSHLVSDLYTEGFRKKNYAKAGLNIYQEQRTNGTEGLQDAKLELNHSHVGEPNAGGGFLENDTSFYTINRKNNAQLVRTAFDTSYVIPYTSPNGDIFKLDANLITTGYYVNNLAVEDETNEYTGFQGNVLPSLNFTWRKPFTKNHQNGKVNEIFEPIINLKAAPNNGTKFKIPNEDSQDFEFDDTNLFENIRNTGLDRLDGGHRVDYGFNWGIYGFNGGYTQLFLGQSYRLRDDETYDSNSGLEDNFSDLVGRIEVSPSEFMDLLHRFRFDKDDLSYNRNETTLSIGPDASRFNLSYLYIEGSGEDSEFDTREEVYAALSNKISKYWSSTLDGRYRLNDPEGSVSYGGRVTYQDDCITIYGDFRREFSDDEDIDPADSFTIRIELKNLGGISAL